MTKNDLASLITASAGGKKAQLVLKNALVVNVFTNEIAKQDIAIENGVIAGLGSYDGETEIDVAGKYVCPGFIDGHIHIESSMVLPSEFEKAVLPHGTTAVVADPHEITNVAGTQGLDFMLAATDGLCMDTYFMLPSCVPCTPLDESGAKLDAAALAPYFGAPRVLGLAEMMDYFGVTGCNEEVLDKLLAAKAAGVHIDGHAPSLTGKAASAYIAAGVESDHECGTAAEALEKLRKGQYIMVREGTAAKNLTALLPLFKEPLCERAMLVTDDKHPNDLLNVGHIDAILRKAVANGADSICAVKMSSYVTAKYFGIKNRGAVAPGYAADLAVVDNLTDFNVCMVFKDGVLAAKDGKMLADAGTEPEKGKYPRVFNSFKLDEIKPQSFALASNGAQKQRVICLTNGELLTTEKIMPVSTENGCDEGVDTSRDVVKFAVIERHNNTGHIGLGFLGGYGLKCGAVATSISHDSHNLIVAGTTSADMALAANAVRSANGGLAVAINGKVKALLPLEAGGLMSTLTLDETQQQLENAKNILYANGVPRELDPFMTLSFASLSVIPALRLTTKGIIDVNTQKFVEAYL